MIRASGLRPITGPRVELLGTTGTNATHDAALRATERRGRFGVELTGRVHDSDGYTPVARPGAVDGRAAVAQQDAGGRVEHATDASRARAFARWSNEHRETGTQYHSLDASIASLAVDWRLVGSRGRLDAQLFGDSSKLVEERPFVAPDRSTAVLAGKLTLPVTTRGGRVGLSRNVHALGLDHELSIGGGLVQRAAESIEAIDPEMEAHMTTLARTRRGEHRFLDAYIHDTIRVIESLDISGGFVFEHWSWLTRHQNTAYDTDDQMAEELPEITELLFGPQLGAVYRVDDHLALRGRAYRTLRAPTIGEQYRPVQTGDVLTAANDRLKAERVSSVEVGPVLTAGPLEARAVAFWSAIDAPINAVTIDATTRQRQNLDHARATGVDTEASWRMTRALRATVGYTFANTVVTEAAAHPGLVGKQVALAPRNRAVAALTFDDPKLVTLSGALRYVGRQFHDDRNEVATGAFSVVDAVAARKLAGGVAGFLSVDNLFDRRYVASRAGIDTLGAPRMIAVGVRVDSSRF